MKMTAARWMCAAVLLLVSGPGLAQMLRTHHTTEAQVLAIDSGGQRIHFYTSDGRTLTLPVEGAALETYTGFSRGELVTLSCRDYQPGEHFAIFEIARRR